jgi:hypothetical protein
MLWKSLAAKCVWSTKGFVLVGPDNMFPDSVTTVRSVLKSGKSFSYPMPRAFGEANPTNAKPILAGAVPV